ncbi:MAG: 6-bladed beta-propeller [Prevotellaceae bacterium]|jgi:hypothetical protein|nr:6-bladed beta-propeller [Prevotellaceae bacterium]
MDSSIRIIIVLIFILLSVGCKDKKTNIHEGLQLKDGGKIIRLNPEKGRTIKLSEIVDEIQIVFLESSEDAVLSNIDKIEMDNDLFFILNAHDKLVYVFDADGNFKNKIGSIGQGPGDVLYPACFAINRQEKEIWLTSNFQFICKYDYNGSFLNREPLRKPLNLFFRDFYIDDNKDIYFHTSKFINYAPNNDFLCWNFWIMTPDQEFKTYFPYSSEVYPNGGSYFETFTPFGKSGDNIRYHYAFNDTVFIVDKYIVRPLYIIDFGEKKCPVDLSSISGDNASEYIFNSNYATFLNNVVETDNSIMFKYVITRQKYNVFYNKNSNNMVEGILENDILGAEIMILNSFNNKFTGYINANDISIKELASKYINANVLDKLKALNEADNPILIEIKLKDF